MQNKYRHGQGHTLGWFQSAAAGATNQPTHHLNTMKIPQIISNPPAWLAVIFCLIGASVYLVTLIALKNLLHWIMDSNTPIGTMTNKGTYRGMEGHLATFEQYIAEGRTMITKCSPKIVKVISMDEENQRIADEHECRDLGIWYQTILRGSDAQSAISSFRKSISV